MVVMILTTCISCVMVIVLILRVFVWTAVLCCTVIPSYFRFSFTFGFFFAFFSRISIIIVVVLVTYSWLLACTSGATFLIVLSRTSWSTFHVTFCTTFHCTYTSSCRLCCWPRSWINCASLRLKVTCSTRYYTVFHLVKNSIWQFICWTFNAIAFYWSL